MRRHLSSKEMIIVLDNAESILGLAETNAQKIYTVMDELSQFSNIWLIFTSRVSNSLPPHCEIVEVPTLSMEAGQATFYLIYNRLDERPDEINEILKELDFHPLSITLLATTAQQNRWNTKRLTTQWEKQRTGVLRARNMGSLAATIELSLASPMFQELGPDAREILGVVAFFPQGVNEDNADGEFPTISDGPSMFDAFCNLSLTYRGHGSITMLAPFRDYLRPKDPMASSLLLMAKEYYFRRLSVALSPGKPGFDESRWITSEDVNVEHLIDAFTSTDVDSKDIWDACYRFMDHLHWHKPRPIILGSKIEALPNSHPSKPHCLVFLARLFYVLGNWAERKRVLVQSFELWRERGKFFWVADTLVNLADANMMLDLREEGIQQARRALNFFDQADRTERLPRCLLILASLLHKDQQLDEAEQAATRAMDLSENRDQLELCQSHRILGAIHRTKGNTEKALHHFEESLRIASVLGWGGELPKSHLSLAELYLEKGKFDNAHGHIKRAKSLAGNDVLLLGSVFFISALVSVAQNRPEEAKPEALRALGIWKKLGATGHVEEAGRLLKHIEEVV